MSNNLTVNIERSNNTSPSLQQSRILSPRLAGALPSPRIPGHHRKSSSNVSAYAPSTPATSSWSFLGGRNNPQRSPSLPYSKRNFYTDSNPSTSFLSTLRNIFLRPIYLISRRGPLFPLIALLAIIILIVTYSTNPSTQSVKRRVQGAVGPYIPRRAASAMNWRGRTQAVLSQEDEDELPVKGKAIKGKPKAPKVKSPLAPPRKDGRILIEAGQEHPIPGLMARAKLQWADLQARQSKTFKDAVTEYVKRYGKRPPAGLDHWFVFDFFCEIDWRSNHFE